LRITTIPDGHKEIIEMARIQIELPEKFLYSTDRSIRIEEINRARHLAHDKVLTIAEEARDRFLEYLGYKDRNIDGASFIVVDAGIIYKKQGFYGQTLKIEIAITDLSSKGCDIIFKISNAETGEEMIRAKTGMLFYDYRTQKVVVVPESFRKKVSI
jgi:4-hydroxybenzoyl-CoA thioesterase